MDTAYDTPHWAQVILRALIITGLLSSLLPLYALTAKESKVNIPDILEFINDVSQ